MTNRKNQNSILVLATLGVYLGLVLVGATPQILAQAAMTKQFNVKDEIEVKDDLDKKPKNDLNPLIQTIHIYFQDLDGYLLDVQKADERLHANYDSNEAKIAGNYLGVYKRDPESVLPAPCYRIGDSNRPFDLETVAHATILPILLNPQYVDENWSWAPMACNPRDGSKRAEVPFTEIEVSGTQKGVLTYQLSIKPLSTGQTSILFNNLRRTFERFDTADFNDRQKVLWKNTKLTQTEDKVLIVTRLPRAGLDSLLAANAK